MSAATLPAVEAVGTDQFANLLLFLNRLSAGRIPYTLRHSREDAVMVEVTVPGERWEIDFLDDGDVDVEVFRSVNGVSAANGQLDDLIRTHSSVPGT